ncbi:ATP-binding protein [Azospirillum sp. TSO22-1]|uniref:ATP-binding protein n=1 Tax=Azospirillum sp. TSO22-1 TaxID=716789 RepID=UPI000D651CC9|nr:ATP-binding protein [Azospirillum sp. TSO22-1]
MPDSPVGAAEPAGDGRRAHATIDGLVRRGLVALLAIVLLAGTAALLMHGAVSSLDHTAELINLSGRQRMLTQRAALFATRLAAAEEMERTVLQAELRTVLDDIVRAQEVLTGSPAMLPEVQALYAGVWRTEDGTLHRTVESLRPFLSAQPRGLPVPRVDEVLAELDALTARVVALVNAAVQRSWLLSLIVFAVIAGTAVVTIPLAILPPSRLVHRQVDDMTALASRLEAARAEADEANRAKSDFLSRMSHELRTPLNAILGFGQLLHCGASAPLTAQQATCVGHILEAGDHLLQLINDILDLAKIEAGKVQLAVEDVYLDTVLHECLTMTEAMAAKHGVAVRTDPPGPELAVSADHMRLRQVVLNLLTNAIKYNRPNGTVTLACRAAGSGRLRLSVADTGPGIPEALRPKLFQPFTRLIGERREIEGNGIGLTIARQLAEMMGGTLDYTTTEDEGTTFWVELPLAGEVLAPGPHPNPPPLGGGGDSAALPLEPSPAQRGRVGWGAAAGT